MSKLGGYDDTDACDLKSESKYHRLDLSKYTIV